MVTACMASTGSQKGHVPPISGGKVEQWGQLISQAISVQ